MSKLITERLKEEEQDAELKKLASYVRTRVKRSRTKMSDFYDVWDRNNDVYKGIKTVDEEDRDANDHNEPEKMVVPLSFAQVQTFVAFCFLLFTQNRRMYELVATGSEDTQAKNDSEKLLERDQRRNDMSALMYQQLLDVARFGIGVYKTWWSVEKQVVNIPVPATSAEVDGVLMESAATTSSQSLTKYEGNRISVISPYNFFPDPRFPLSEWKKGSYAADETEWHVNDLKKEEAYGVVHGVEHIKLMDKTTYEKRGETRLEGFDTFMNKDGGKREDDMIVLVTTCQVEIIPADFDLGTEKVPVKYIVQLANDDRVIRAEPLNYLHDEFTYDVGLFSYDRHNEGTMSLADVIGPMQDVVSFFFNSRLMSIRKSLDNNLVIDPSGVDMSTVESRSPFILMKKGSPRLGVDKFVRQLSYQDNTVRHLDDANVVMQLMQTATGLNENAMGQYSGGRRSATEARAVTAGSAARPKLVATVLWNTCYDSMGRKLLSNLRQGLSIESWRKVIGKSPEAEARYAIFKPADITELVGNEDYFMFDATLQTEKGFIAQSLQELVSAMLSTPEVMQILPLDVGKIMEEILVLRGIDNIERFRYAQPTGPLQQPGLPTTGVMPQGLESLQGVGGLPSAG